MKEGRWKLGTAYKFELVVNKTNSKAKDKSFDLTKIKTNYFLLAFKWGRGGREVFDSDTNINIRVARTSRVRLFG